MNITDIDLTGGDGSVGQSGQDVLDNILLGLSAALGDKEYIPSNFTWSTANLSGFANKTLVIQHTHTATVSFAFPANVTLEFQGGSLIITGSITGNMTKIVNPSNTQILSTLTTFNGTWAEVLATPQWFGGKTSANPTVAEAQGAINIKPIVDKIIASPFGLRYPVGCYYMRGGPNIINKPMVVVFDGDHLEDGFLTSITYQPNHVRFYTDDDTSFFEIRSTGVVMEGFSIDITLASTYNKPTVFIHADNKVNGCRLSYSVLDTIGHCRAAVPDTNTGAKGFEFIVAGSIWPYGSLTDLRLNINTRFVAYPVIFNEVSTSGQLGTWATSNYVSGTWNGYKKFYIAGMSGSQHKIFLQTNYTLNQVEMLGLYSGYVGASQLDIVPWDLSGTEYQTSGWFYNKLGIVLGSNVTLTGNSLLWYKYGAFSGEKPVSTSLVDNSSGIVLLRDRWSSSTFISQLDNTLIGFEEQGNTYSIQAYDGSLIDFDSDLEDGNSPATANITLWDDDNLFSFNKPITSANNPPRWQFLAGADLDKDYIELVLIADGSNIVSNFLHFHMLYETTKCKRIQVIGTTTLNAVVVYDLPIPALNSKHASKLVTDKSFKKLIIRFIGSTNTTGTIYLLDLANQNNHRNNILYWVDRTKRYRAYLTQTGTSAPTAGVEDPNNYFSPTFTYVSPGKYRIYSYRSFKENKCFPMKAERVDITTGNTITLTRLNEDNYEINTLNSSGVASDGILNNELIDIEVIW